MFMHAGWLHLGGNMLYCGFRRQRGGPLRDITFLIFYLLCGLAPLAHSCHSPRVGRAELGASGAIAGVLGAYILMFPQGWVRVLLYTRTTLMPAWIVIGLWSLCSCSAGIGSIAKHGPVGGGGVAYMAHVGGFVRRARVGILFRGSPRGRRRVIQPNDHSAPFPTLKWLAIAAILARGLIHIVEAPDAFGEAAYKGALFVANGMGALWPRTESFEIGADQDGPGPACRRGALLAYVASRTVGLPGAAGRARRLPRADGCRLARVRGGLRRPLCPGATVPDRHLALSA